MTMWRFLKICVKFASLLPSIGAIAQLVEHRTENPGVPGSIPGGTTKTNRRSRRVNDLRDLFLGVLMELLIDSSCKSNLLIN